MHSVNSHGSQYNNIILLYHYFHEAPALQLYGYRMVPGKTWVLENFGRSRNLVSVLDGSQILIFGWFLDTSYQKNIN